MSSDAIQNLLKQNVLDKPDFNSGKKVVRQNARNRKAGNDRQQPQQALTQWFGFQRGEKTPEAMAALRVMQQRHFLSDDTKFRRMNKAAIPDFFQIGTVVADPLNPHKRLTKKMRRSNLVDEIAAAPDLADSVAAQRQQTMMEGVMARSAKPSKAPRPQEEGDLGQSKRRYAGKATRKALHTQLRKGGASKGKGKGGR